MESDFLKFKNSIVNAIFETDKASNFFDCEEFLKTENYSEIYQLFHETFVLYCLEGYQINKENNQMFDKLHTNVFLINLTYIQFFYNECKKFNEIENTILYLKFFADYSEENQELIEILKIYYTCIKLNRVFDNEVKLQNYQIKQIFKLYTSNVIEN
jgi:hypothetical protein